MESSCPTMHSVFGNLPGGNSSACISFHKPKQ
jgi:hypothetical protein